MNLERIASSVDTAKLADSKVAVVGVGGSANLDCNLARTGVPSFQLFDFDFVADSNIARQEHHPDQIGRLKVDAVADAIHRINPAARVQAIDRDFLTLTDRELDRYFQRTSLIIFAADNFAVSARGNQIALRLNKPALWIGLYPQGLAGEIVFWHPGLDACLRCLCHRRYEAHERARETGEKLDPTSDGCTIFDISLVDAIAGQIAIGLLTQGSPNRYGRIIDELGDRNFIQIQNDSQFAWNGRPLFREQLQVPLDNDRFYSWISLARRDPSPQPCLDCEQFRGHRFVQRDGHWMRIKPEEETPNNADSSDETHIV